MTTLELILIAIGLAMDAFAVAVCRGLKMKKINYAHGTVIALFFGGFQALMPVIGWFLGFKFEKYIVNFDHWIAFALLAFIGVRMIIEAVKDDEEECGCCGCEKLNIKELTVMAVATSIDALAIGITFAFLRVNIAVSAGLIGIITFVISFIGVIIGHVFGSKLKSKAEIAGGAILVLIGLKILLDHLGVFEWFIGLFA
jgi:putative Mn2+ efflux pump MntP